MGDYIRWSPPYYEGAHESARSALFLSLNRNKRSIRLDLKNERGREALLRLVRDYDVVLESFRPGVLDRLGVGYERMREENPGSSTARSPATARTAPSADASGHDMNYLGLIGLLGLTGERGGEPVQAAGQIADLGGGALMAAFGILAALHERDGGSGAGPARGRVDGRRRAVVAGDGRGDVLRRRQRAAPRRSAAGRLADLLPPVRVRRRLGLAGRARAEVLAGLLPRRRPRGPDRGAVRAPGLATPHAQVREIFKARSARAGRRSRASTTAAWSRCWSSTRRSPQSSCASARWSSRSTQPGAERPVRQLGLPVKLSRTPGEHARLPGPALGEHTEEVLLAAGYSPQEVAELLGRRGGGPRGRPRRHGPELSVRRA